MKVLLVSPYLLPHSGGIEVLVDQEARLLGQAVHEVVLLGSNAGKGDFLTYPPNVRVCRVRAWNGLEQRWQIPWPVFSPAVLPLLWRYVRWCDVVHANGFLYFNSFLALVFARILGKGTLLTEHMGMAWYPSRLKRLLQRLAVESVGRASVLLAREGIGYHQGVVGLLRRLAGGKGRVRFIPNPLNRDLFRPPCEAERRQARQQLGWPLDRPKVLFVGRLIIRKGIDLLLEAKDPRYDLVFCGRGDPSILGDLSSNGVSYLPPRSQADLVPLYHAADVLAIPSRSEGGLVLVAQEALACGLPVLLGEDPGLGFYRPCEGLHFCALNSKAISQVLLQIMECRPKTDSSTGPHRVPFDTFLPDGDDWLRQLFPSGQPPVTT